LRELREILRALALANQRSVPPPAVVGVIGRRWPDARLRVELNDQGETRLQPTGESVDAAVATLVGILHEAQVLGTWARMKGCMQCGYAFYDRSKNRSAAWCAMSICGNRTKNRTYRQRRCRHDPGPQRCQQHPTKGEAMNSASPVGPKGARVREECRCA
jgi:predicted RNA-binding Zn ribbon-like protein